MEERARPPLPRVEGATVHLTDLHLMTFRHDPRTNAAARFEEQKAGVARLAAAAMAEHGGKLGVDFAQEGKGLALTFREIVSKKKK